MRRWLLLVALLLPIVGLGLGLWRHQSALEAAGEWRIPVTGADPRDLLRGHFVAFSYGWEVRGDPGLCDLARGCQICLERGRGVVIAEVTVPGAACATPVDPGRSGILVRPGLAGGPPLFTGRLFVSEASAPGLEEQLRQGPMLVVALRTPDGRLVNRRLEPLK